MPRLENVVCLVTGASRGIGRGIALGLGAEGATVYITGRTLKPKGDEIEGSLEETAAEINSRGGKAIPVVVDHSEETQITDLFVRIRREQRGRLDVLVNNAYSAVPFLKRSLGKAYYEIDAYSPGEVWDEVNNVGLRNHYICSALATKVMIDYKKQEPSARPGLIINISSFGACRYAFSAVYGCGKAALDRLTHDMNVELKRNKVDVCVISLWPGLVRTEEMMNVAVNTTKEFLAAFRDPSLSESTELCGLAVAAIACEKSSALMARSDNIVLVSDVVAQYALRVPGEPAPPNYRSLKLLLRLGGYRLAWLVPGFIRIPKFLFLWFLSFA